MKRFWPGGSRKKQADEKAEPVLPMETGELPRTDRFLRTDSGWYAKTREPEDLGPYESLEQAQMAMARHLKRMAGLPRSQESPEFKLGIFVHDSETCPKTKCALCIEAKESADRKEKTLPGAG